MVLLLIHRLSIDVLSAALDSGVAIGAILVFFCLQYPKNGTIGADTIAEWWGNTVYTKTADWQGAVLKTVNDGDIFGYVHIDKPFYDHSIADLHLHFRPTTWG